MAKFFGACLRQIFTVFFTIIFVFALACVVFVLFLIANGSIRISKIENNMEEEK